MSLWKTLQESEKQPPINIVNGDIKSVEIVDGGATTVVADTTPRGPSQRPKFAPVMRSKEETRALYEQTPVETPAPPSDNFDLVGDISGAPAVANKRVSGTGRPRVHANDAAKQAAYRNRLRIKNNA